MESRLGTNWSSSTATRWETCSNQLYPWPCRAMYGESGSRIGSAVAVHTSPESSSRMYITSLGGSLTASFDQPVTWFSWLLTDQVWPEPDSDT